MLQQKIPATVITGFLGGLTTFSTFSAEVMRLLTDGRTLEQPAAPTAATATSSTAGPRNQEDDDHDDDEYNSLNK